MADGLDATHGFELLFGPLSVGAGGLQVSIDEFDRLEQTTGGLTLPNLAKATAAQALDELVTGDRLCAAFEPYRHGHVPVESAEPSVGLRFTYAPVRHFRDQDCVKRKLTLRWHRRLKNYILTVNQQNANYSLPSSLKDGNWDVLGLPIENP